MKAYSKPEIKIENLFSSTAFANDPFDFTGGNGNEVEVSATDWWDLLA
jgi:hypothetical protein